MNVSLAKQSWGPKVWSAIQGNVPGDSIDKDIHHEGTRQRGTMKYLRESCYHRIECYVANSLATLMYKWYMNSNFQPYSYSQRLQEVVDGTRINVRNLVYTWRVEMKEWGQYKKERIPWGVRIGEEEKNTVIARTILVIKFKRNIYKNQPPRIVLRMILFR